MAKLYELAQNYKNLTELIEDQNIPQEVIENALKEVEGDIGDKLENIAKLIKNIESDIDGYKKEEKRLSERRKTLENKIKGLKQYMEEAMRFAKLKKVKGNVFTLSLQKNAPKAIITNEKGIPQKYLIQQNPLIDKRKILKALKDGEIIEGAKLEQSESLRIR